MSLQSNDANSANGSTITGTITGKGKIGSIQVPNANANRRKRTSSLMQAAAALPTVESSLEDFISRANSTSESASWSITGDAAAQEAKASQAAQQEAEAEQRRQADAVRWRQAEAQLRSESEAKENALRKQIEILQNRLAATEARVVIAADGESNGAAAVAAMAQLQTQLAKAEERTRSTETALHIAQNKVNELAASAANPAGNTKATSVTVASAGDSELRTMMEASERRAKIADVRATKALAAARAATAGLTVSHDDLEGIASGLHTDMEHVQSAAKTPWLRIGGAFAGGLVVMFAAFKLIGSPAPAPVAIATPVVAPVVATAPETVAPAAHIAVPPVVVAPAPVAETNKIAPNAATVEPIVVPSVEPIAQEAKPAKRQVARTRVPARASGSMADPFAEPKAAAQKPAKTKIVDPF